MRKILITNDDGIESDRLIRLVKVAKEFGEVWVVAPDGQRSACSHSITVHGMVDIYPFDLGVEGVKAYTCSGSPGDCVRVGSLSVMPYKPDVVLSGINRGYNSATDIQYSGTCGAAFEAAFQEYLGIAISEGFRGNHDVTDKYLRDILAEVIDKKLGFGEIWNINFPECPLEDFQGILRDRTVSVGKFYKDSYKVVETLPNGGKRYVIDGKEVREAEDGSDLRALFDNYISIGIVKNVGL
ncbi:MAG: 5'/3'-nucleotidase SurE [Eubacterium sp.]|nr:5'/3'-nucleotidase SurE [Eubacterium sp.]